MKPIAKIIICCGLVLTVTQGAIAADATPAFAPSATTNKNQTVKKPTKVTVDREQIKKRLEDRGIQAKKRRALAKQKALEQQNATPAAGK